MYCVIVKRKSELTATQNARIRQKTSFGIDLGAQWTLPFPWRDIRQIQWRQSIAQRPSFVCPVSNASLNRGISVYRTLPAGTESVIQPCVDHRRRTAIVQPFIRFRSGWNDEEVCPDGAPRPRQHDFQIRNPSLQIDEIGTHSDTGPGIGGHQCLNMLPTSDTIRHILSLLLAMCDHDARKV